MYRLTDGIEFMKSLPDHSVDGIFTDPPWAPARSSRRKYSTYIGGYPRNKVELRNAENWLEIIEQMTDQGVRVLRPTGRCLIWIGAIHLGPVCRAIKSLEYRWALTCRYMPPRYVGSLQSFTDFILIYLPFGASLPGKIDGLTKPQEYYSVSSGKKDTDHPCARPFRSVKDILRSWFREEEYVIDPFAGSDTTGRAARELNLKWDTCEIDPKMYRTGIERHRQGILFENK